MTEAGARARQLRLFGAMWALAALFHTEMDWLVTSAPPGAVVTGALVGLSALAVLALPARPIALALLAGAEIADVVCLLPDVPNHWLLAAFIDLALLGAFARASVRARSLEVDGAAWLDGCIDAIRAAVALFYAFTCFWKLNSDFFVPEWSCAAVAVRRVGDFFHVPSGLVPGRLVVAMTIAMEGLGPVALLVRRTRPYAVLAFVVFHVFLGLDAAANYLNFSSVMFALVVLFLEPEAIERARARWRPLAQGTFLRIVAIAAFTAMFVLTVAASASPSEANSTHTTARFLAFLAYAAHVLAFVAIATLSTPRGAIAARVRPRGAIFYALVLLVFANGIAPWLGVKTRGSWQMYSNVRIEADRSNHFVVPRSLDLFGMLRDRVEVLAVSDPGLAHVWVDARVEVPFITFRAEMARRPSASVRYRRAGVEHAVARVSDDPTLRIAPPWPARALFFFQPVGPAAAKQCVW